MSNKAPRLFCFGLGYSAKVLAKVLIKKGWSVSGTCRDGEHIRQLQSLGIKAFLFDGKRPLANADEAMFGVSHLLGSVPPDDVGDPVLRHHQQDIAGIKGLAWTGYLSTTGVYGDTNGQMVDETAPLNPSSKRSSWRLDAEKEWLALANSPAHIFRLSGIYGPNSSVLDKVRDGSAKRIAMPGHLFSRIHVNDIAKVLMASMARPHPGTIYNVADDEAAMASEVVAFACELLNIKPPPLIPFATAAKEMSPMALSFWRDNRVIDNQRIKKELAVKLQFSNYRLGLKGLL